MYTSERVRRWRDFPDRMKQRAHKLAPRVTLFHQFDDPYSLLAIEASAQLVDRYNIDFELILVNDPPTAGHSFKEEAAQNWMRYRLHDDRRLAQVWRLNDSIRVDMPSKLAVEASSKCLAAAPPSTRAALALKLTRAMWSGDEQELSRLLTANQQGSQDDVHRMLVSGHNERTERGHYRAAMWEFNGDWFWGLDRLQYLEDDLSRWNLAKGGQSVYAEWYTPTQAPRVQAETLDVFFSFRSPYSYLSLRRLDRLQEEYGVRLKLRFRPVLPMVERGVELSSDKRAHILKDAARIANKHQIAFGYVRDPLGDGLRRCLALFYHAQQKGKAREFVNSVMQGIWAEAFDINSERGLRKLTERAGLDFDQARDRVFDDSTSEHVEKNQHQLELMGLWGVPTFALTNNQNQLVDVFWGQDRLPWLEYGLKAPLPGG